MRAIAGLLVVVSLVFVGSGTAAADDTALKALLITGGCCHDYTLQTEILKSEMAKRANVDWTVVNQGGTTKDTKIPIYDNPKWADGYDVVVHNECFADVLDEKWIAAITARHKQGVNAVVIHCAMHTYRAIERDDWREFLGVTSRRHEHQSPKTVTSVAKDHPVMAGFPAQWKSPSDELYIIEKLWPNATALATGLSESHADQHPAFWVNQFGAARVFGTTFGHSNETFQDSVFLDTFARGLLWAAGKLDASGNPVAGAGPQR